MNHEEMRELAKFGSLCGLTEAQGEKMCMAVLSLLDELEAAHKAYRQAMEEVRLRGEDIDALKGYKREPNSGY